MTTTKDIGCAIAETLNDFVEHIQTWNWPNNHGDDPIPTDIVDLVEVDASHGFDRLIITTSDEKQFLVRITPYSEK